jgi:hypothetical protein
MKRAMKSNPIHVQTPARNEVALIFRGPAPSSFDVGRDPQGAVRVVKEFGSGCAGLRNMPARSLCQQRQRWRNLATASVRVRTCSFS